MPYIIAIKASAAPYIFFLLGFYREKTPSLTDDIMIINCRMFSDESMLKFKNSLQQVNSQTILNIDDTNRLWRTSCVATI